MRQSYEDKVSNQLDLMPQGELQEWNKKPVNIAEIEALRPQHPHPPTTSNEYRAAQMLIDRNMSMFTSWLKDKVKAAHKESQVTSKEGKMLRMFFIYIRRSMHIAVCAQAWHYLNVLVKNINDMVQEDAQALKSMSEKLADPSTKDDLARSLGIERSDLEEVDAGMISKAFKKMFGKPFTRDVLTEFIEQSKFIRDNLYRMGFA